MRGLLRFELKPELQASVAREEAKIERAWASWQAGEYRSGKHYGALHEAARDAKRTGADPDAAAESAWHKLLTDARGAPKRDLRLWSPAQYRPGGRRGSDDVVHVSCLVLDYDKGLPFDEAQAAWLPWFHVAHSTWSHRVEKPKFRIILPMAAPVRADDWRGVWDWAEGLAGAWVDPAMKGRAATFALPATPDEAAERIAVLHDGAPLLDPVLEGLIQQPAPPAPPIADIDRPSSHFNGGVAGHRYLELAPPEPVEEPPETLDVSGEWDIAPPEPPPAAPAPSSPGAEESWDERSDEWDDAFDALD